MSNKKLVFFMLIVILWGSAVGFSLEETVVQEDPVMPGEESAVLQESPLPQEMTGNPPTMPGMGVPEEAMGVSGAVQMAQEEVRDPFETQLEEGRASAATGTVSGETLVEVSLQGIGFGVDDAYAVLNGEIYYTGEEKQGIKLLAVRRREVDILANGNMQILKLIDEAEVKKATEGRRKKKEPVAS